MTLKLYHISEKNLNNKILIPKIPNNYLTKNNFEENKTKRICFSKTISGALTGLSQNIENKEYFVHTAIINQNTIIKNPNTFQVPDSELTKEVWILNKIKLKKEFKIKVKKSYQKPLEYKLNNKTIQTFKWHWSKIK